MNENASSSEVSDAVLEIGRKFYPRRRRRHPDLRPYLDACEWARSLDWRNNPYDRFLLRRELLHYIDSADHMDCLCRVRRFAAPGEIAAIVDYLLDCHQPKRDGLGVFTVVALRFPWEFTHRHGMLRYSHLTKALHSIDLPRNGGDT